MERPSWAPGSIDLERPSAARIYDYCLGGWHNFAADRATAEQTIRLMPELPRVMRSNRSFLRRAVQFCLGAGVRQFLDLGSGIPTVGNVHEVAQRVDPRARVVYVDVDPVAVAHSQAILADTAGAAAILADLRDPERILADEQLRGLLDLDRPVAVLMVAVLHFVPDSDDPAGIVARYRSATAPGSYLALSHATFEGDPDRFASAKDQYERAVTPVTLRSRDEIAALFAGFDLVEPRLVRTPLWRPESPDDVDDDPERGSTSRGSGASGEGGHRTSSGGTHRYPWPMAAADTDLDHPPEGVVILPAHEAEDKHLDPRAWVDTVRRPTPRRLRQRVADHLARARELGEV